MFLIIPLFKVIRISSREQYRYSSDIVGSDIELFMRFVCLWWKLMPSCFVVSSFGLEFLISTEASFALGCTFDFALSFALDFAIGPFVADFAIGPFVADFAIAVMVVGFPAVVGIFKLK